MSSPLELLQEFERELTYRGVDYRKSQFQSLRAAIEAQAEELLVSKKGWDKARERLDNGRDYLMQVPAADITVDDALTAFGFDRCGFPPEES